MDSDALLDRKLARLFDQLDAHGRGVLTEDDHMQLARRVAEAFGHVAASAEAQRVRDSYLGLWHRLLAPADRDGDGCVHRAEYVAALRPLASDRAGYRQSVGAVVTEFAAAADGDGDGFLDLDEYIRLCRAMFPNMPRDEAIVAFHLLDTDHDGRLAHEELIRAVEDYVTDTAAPGAQPLGEPQTAR